MGHVKAVEDNEKRKLGSQEVCGMDKLYIQLHRPSLLHAIWCAWRKPISNSRQSFGAMKIWVWILDKIKIFCANMDQFRNDFFTKKVMTDFH